MATQSLRILEGTENWLPRKQSTSYGGSASTSIEDLGLFLKGQRFDSLRKDTTPNRSESAPPSMEGSIAALENILSWRTSNLNPILVHPSVSKAEDSMLLPTGNLPVRIEEEVEDDISSEMSGSLNMEKGVLLTHNEGAFDLTQEDSHQTSLPSYQYCSSSDKSTDKTVNLEGDSVSASTSTANVPSAEDGKRRILVRPPPIETHFNTVNLDPKDDLFTTKVINKDVAHIQSGIGGVSLSSASNSDYHKIRHSTQVFFDNNMQQHVSPQQGNPYRTQLNRAYSSNHFHYGSPSISTPEVQPILQSSGFTPPLYASAAAQMASPNPFYPSVLPSGYYASQYGVGGYTFHPAVLGVSMQPPLSDPFQMQYIRQPLQDAYGVYGHFGHPTPRDGAIMSQLNACDPKNRPQLIAYSANQNFLHQPVAGYNILSPSRGNGSSFGSPTNVGPYVQFPISPVMSPNWGGANTFSFLEDLKLGKGQKYKLSDIAGRVAEVSVDQHGSRFIQQKLEYCSPEEKESLFKEVVPNASKLMTDVFGNYVIQKLFEHGTTKQRKDLANQLTGQVFPLSLQMYGCRVIQKAFEVIDTEQKVKLVRELDGHVMTCVRDQNGNHVIQKCIESTPVADISFIISSFRGEVASLSMHPYGCRVIQRVLEHCNEELQTQFIVDEILESVCTLIQDQYGNYVTQHVLERGKPHERSQIISKITGSVVQLSQHKFASNVVEKCLEYSDSTARETLIKEIIGHGDKNDNLLIMMKDQYANYVIQKMLQKCCDDQREVLLGLIRNHLTALKKYTYGKHIVARFEHLCGQEIQTSES